MLAIMFVGNKIDLINLINQLYITSIIYPWHMAIILFGDLSWHDSRTNIEQDIDRLRLAGIYANFTIVL